MIRFTVPGRPVTWQRVRRRGGQYFPARRLIVWQQKAGWCARKALGPLGKSDAPIRLTVRVFVTGSAGDADNYVKALMDAMNGVAWHDDRQVKRIEAGVERAADHGEQRMEVEIEEVAA